MAISLKSTRELGRLNGVKMLVYGQAGSGKTTLIGTLPNPVILSAESGLLSLADLDLPVIEITDAATLRDARRWLAESEEAAQFESVALDSISEIAETVLAAAKATAKDPRQAYGQLSDDMNEIVRGFRDLPGKHVYFSAKAEKATDESGRILWSPSAPGKSVGQSLPYFFDEVLSLRVEKGADGELVRGLLTSTDGQWVAKDRSGKLDQWEAPDLGAIINKITGQG